MSEQRIQITVNTDSSELADLIGKFNAGNITIGETTKLKKLLNAEARQTVNILQLESAESKKYTEALKTVEKAQSDLRVATGAGHEQYFRLGTELRQRTLPAMTSFANIVQDSSQFSMGFSQGVRAIGNNIEYLTQQMVILRSQGLSMSQILKGMAANIMGAGGVLLAISALTTAVTIISAKYDDWFESGKKTKQELKEEADQARETAKEIKELIAARRGARFGVGSMTPEQYLNATREEMQRVISEAVVTTRSKEGFEELIKYKGFENVKVEDYAITNEKKRELLDLQSRYISLKREEQRVVEEITKAEEKQSKFSSNVDWGITGVFGSLRSSKPGDRPQSVNDIMRPQVQTASEYIDLWDQTEKQKLESRETALEESARREAEIGIGVVRTIAGVIEGEFRGAWVSAFGEANSLFEKLAMNITSFLATNLIKSGLSSLLNILLPGSGFVAQLGLSAVSSGRTTGARTVDEMVNTGGFGRMQPIIIPVFVGGDQVGEAAVDYMGRSIYRRAL